MPLTFRLTISESNPIAAALIAASVALSFVGCKDRKTPEGTVLADVAVNGTDAGLELERLEQEYVLYTFNYEIHVLVRLESESTKRHLRLVVAQNWNWQLKATCTRADAVTNCMVTVLENNRKGELVCEAFFAVADTGAIRAESRTTGMVVYPLH